MDISLKVFVLLFFFCLSAANLEFKSGSEENPDEKSHIEQNKETREFLKSEMNKSFSSLLKLLSQKLTESNSQTLSKLENLNQTISKININEQELSLNLSRTLNESIGDVYLSVTNSFNQEISGREMQTENSLRNLSETLAEKLWTTELTLEKSLANSSVLLSEELRRSELKVEASLGNFSETLKSWLHESEPNGTEVGTTLGTDPQLPSTIPATTTSTEVNPTQVIPTQQSFIPTFLQEVEANSATLYLKRTTWSSGARKIWLLRTPRENFHREMRFVLEKNGLGSSAHLSIWGSGRGDQHVWNGSLESDWREKRVTQGHVILVTLTISPSADEQPNFELRFDTTRIISQGWTWSSEIVTGHGQQVVSYPRNNAQNYPVKSLFVAVIAPHRAFQLTLKHLDTPGTPPDSCDQSSLRVIFLDETPSGEPFYNLDDPVQWECGRYGNISEPLGRYTVAILSFSNRAGRSGRGIRVEVN